MQAYDKLNVTRTDTEDAGKKIHKFHALHFNVVSIGMQCCYRQNYFIFIIRHYLDANTKLFL